MKTWTVEHTSRSGTVLRGQATLADGKITVTWNGRSLSADFLGYPEMEALDLLRELYVNALKQVPPSSSTKQ